MQLAGLQPAAGQQPQGTGPCTATGVNALQGLQECAAQLQALNCACSAAAEPVHAAAATSPVPTSLLQPPQRPSPGLQEALRAALVQAVGCAASSAAAQQARQQLGSSLLELLQCLPCRPDSGDGLVRTAIQIVAGVAAQLQLLGALPTSSPAAAPAEERMLQVQRVGLSAVAVALAQPCQSQDLVVYCQQCLELQKRLEVLLGAQAQQAAGAFLRACQRLAGAAAAKALLEGAACLCGQACPAAVQQLVTAFKGAVLLVSSEPLLQRSHGSTDARPDSRRSSGNADPGDEEEQRTCRLVTAAAGLLGWRVRAPLLQGAACHASETRLVCCPPAAAAATTHAACAE
jgi:hypothetical protein